MKNTMIAAGAVAVQDNLCTLESSSTCAVEGSSTLVMALITSIIVITFLVFCYFLTDTVKSR